MRKLSLLFKVLAQSSFRQRFKLSDEEQGYLREKGMATVLAHASDLIQQRLVPAVIPNDGKQTPMRGHPVFVAQHATATCCRKCLQQWHQIPKGQQLNSVETEYILSVLKAWLEQQSDA